MALAANAQATLETSRGTIDGIAAWFAANIDRLPIGLAAAAAIIGLMLLVRWAGVAMRNSDPDCTRFRGVIGRMLAKTGVLFMAATAIEVIATYADVPPKISRIADILFIIAFAIQGAVWGRELILGAIARKVGEDTGESTLANAMSLIRVLVSVALFAIALIVILDNLGVNVTALVAGLGIGGIAIGLAAQGIFSDLFAALAILFDRPFRRGDTINYGGKVDGGGTTGTVERIGLKTTRIRSRTGELVVMANTKLLEQELTNIDEASVYRSWLPFGVVYRTDPALLERMGEVTGAVLKEIKGIRFIRCAVSGFGPSSIDFHLVYDDIGKDFDTRALNRSAICIGILKAFRAEGIDFAYPTQTTYTAAPDGTLVMPWATPDKAAPAKG
ncbi:MAG TPA: mechanosensitive ion channel domain-containing protein [Sphingomicrobium sp.]|nr:mechanosensitive ion channel domain-containing protein [Sphingomicrobium sp.]